MDVDEFFVITDCTVGSLPQLLREYTDYGALAVNWQVLHMHCWHFHGLALNIFLCIPYQQRTCQQRAESPGPDVLLCQDDILGLQAVEVFLVELRIAAD